MELLLFCVHTTCPLFLRLLGLSFEMTLITIVRREAVRSKWPVFPLQPGFPSLSFFSSVLFSKVLFPQLLSPPQPPEIWLLPPPLLNFFAKVTRDLNAKSVGLSPASLHLNSCPASHQPSLRLPLWVAAGAPLSQKLRFTKLPKSFGG